MTKTTFIRAVNNSFRTIPMERKPHWVWLVLDKESILRDGPHHHHNAFLEDRIHDWDWRDGIFRYYGHSCELGATVELYIVFE